MITTLAEIKIRFDRGNALINWLKSVFLIVAAVKYIISLDVILSIILGIAVTILIYFFGWLDLNNFKLFQREAELNTGKYNPYFRKLKRKV
jgi:hypothetical protein